MIIEELHLKNFRNYASLHIAFDPATNIFYGDNAQGKTNILEAIYLCGTTKSHRGSKDKDIIQFENEESHIEMNVKKDEMSYAIDMHLKKNKPKGIAINKVPIQKATEIYGFVHMVFFSPEDLNMIKSGPKERRRFIDRELCQMDNVYLRGLMTYNKLIVQRNTVMREKKYRRQINDLLDVYDGQIVHAGREVIRKRESFIMDLDAIVRPIHRNLTGQKEELELVYEPSTTFEKIEETLFLTRDHDVLSGSTSVGPHRDDLKVLVNGKDIRLFGSQGQQRTAALSLKLAEIELVKNRIQHTPILLLDDVLSELDRSRQEYLLQSLSGTQTFLTCTGVDDFIREHLKTTRIYHVIDGTVETEEGSV